MNIYWDIVNRKLVVGLSDSQPLGSMELVGRDKVYVDLYLVQPTTTAGAYYEAVAAPAGWLPAFSVKAATLDGDLLAWQTVWTLQGDTGHYQGTIDLNTSEMVAALAALTDSTSLSCTCEFYLVDSNSYKRASTQTPLTVLAPVIEGDETDPTSVFLGNPQIKEETIGGQKVLILYNSDGVEYARFTPPGA